MIGGNTLANNVNLYTTPEELNTLHSAAQVKLVSEAAFEIQQRNSIARLINLAANVGEKSAVWNHPITDTIKEELEGNGYKLTQPKRIAKDYTMWQISWE